MPTPIVYGDYLYTCSNAGIVTCYQAKTGKQVYRAPRRQWQLHRLTGGRRRPDLLPERRERGPGRAGRAEVEALAVNPLGEPCLATPAISDGMIFVGTQHHLLGLARKE
jgi:hypothetical protein